MWCSGLRHQTGDFINKITFHHTSMQNISNKWQNPKLTSDTKKCEDQFMTFMIFVIKVVRLKVGHTVFLCFIVRERSNMISRHEGGVLKNWKKA